jgi:hypothetical protein
VPTAKFNRVLWKGLMGAKAYPELKSQLPFQYMHEREAAED